MVNSKIAELVAMNRKADGGLAMSVTEFKEAQYGIPLKHYCLQYLFGSTGLRYGGVYLAAGKPKSCKSPFVFAIGKMCLEHQGMFYLYELEGKASPTLIYSMFSEQEDWLDNKGPFQIIQGVTLEKAESNLFKTVFGNFKKLKAYDTPLLVDWDSISGAATEDVTDKLNSGEVVGKGFQSKPHIMKHFSENWVSVRERLPVVFMGVLQEKEKLSDGVRSPFAGSQKSYGGGDSQLFKAGTLISFSLMGTLPNGKVVKIKTALNGFADARQIEVKFTWDQFGSLETESQGHEWQFAEATARCLAMPKIVGDLRDIIDVKMNDQGFVTCKQFGLDKVTPSEFEAALFNPENSETLNNLYLYHKIERIKPPDEYPAFVERCNNSAEAAKVAEKEAKKAELEAKAQAEKEKEAAKQAKREAKARKDAAAASMKALQNMAKQ